MRMTRSRSLFLALLIGALPVTSACHSAPTLVSSSPSASAQQAVRDAGSQIVANVNSGVEVTRAGWRVVQALPIDDAQKISIGEKILAVTGTSDDPGPLAAIVVALESATSEAGLVATATTALDLFEPLVTELEASDNTSVQMLAVSIRAAMGFARAYVNAAAGGN